LKFKIILFIALNFLPVYFTSRAHPEGEKPVIDTEATCVTASCHADMGKKKYVHGVGVNGKHCIKCHGIVIKDEHVFTLPAKGIELCAQCHSGQYIAPTDIQGSPPEIITDSDIFEEGRETRLHTPFAEGKCTECHDSHESDFYLHLKGSYPEGFYAIFSIETYGLCLQCHKEFAKALTEPRTLTDTGFRNGNLNLHYRHVNKKKGRTCKACHHPHGAENPKLVMNAFDFGLRNLTINFKKTATGGSCAPTCHIPVKYDRYEPAEIRMLTTPRSGEEATPSELRESRKTKDAF
ncbi:MAG: hypothetical protein KAJ10_15750, partial [Thermodesulfovibrionia bacterium]|nr:hypothetical protein [Thermodesulfovibrionia bacterium]